MKTIITLIITIIFPFIALSQGTLKLESFFSESLQADRYYNIYLPEGYESSEDKYQVIYFLHGLTANHNTYLNDGIIKSLLDQNIANGTIQPTIFVVPDGSCSPYGGSFYTNSKLYGDYEDYIINDLIEHIDNNYRTFAEKEKRCIMGHSMGGYGSMKLAMKHSDIFKGVAALSGPLDLNHFANRIHIILNESGGSPPYEYYPVLSKFSTYSMFTMAGAFSPNMDNPPYYVDLPLDENGNLIESVMKKFMEHNPACFVMDFSQNPNLEIFFDCGLQDQMGLYEWNQGFRDSLEKYQIDCKFQSYNGLHGNKLPERIPNAIRFCDSVMNLPTSVSYLNKNEYSVTCSPNPFTQFQIINYELQIAGYVSLKIYDILGNEVAVLVDEFQEAGRNSCRFDGNDLSAEVYLLRMHNGDGIVTKKIVLIR